MRHLDLRAAAPRGRQCQPGVRAHLVPGLRALVRRAELGVEAAPRRADGAAVQVDPPAVDARPVARAQPHADRVEVALLHRVREFEVARRAPHRPGILGPAHRAADLQPDMRAPGQQHRHVRAHRQPHRDGLAGPVGVSARRRGRHRHPGNDRRARLDPVVSAPAGERRPLQIDADPRAGHGVDDGRTVEPERTFAVALERQADPVVVMVVEPDDVFEAQPIGARPGDVAGDHHPLTDLEIDARHRDRRGERRLHGDGVTECVPPVGGRRYDPDVLGCPGIGRPEDLGQPVERALGC